MPSINQQRSGTYEISRSTEPEEGIRVACPTHGEEAVAEPGYQRVAFYCSGCEIEIEVRVHS